eukprot:m.76577 g.76577  ORF g.76577 m.76577 type:complete len:66 (+) comp12565_c0_seq1:165-362(+)
MRKKYHNRNQRGDFILVFLLFTLLIQYSRNSKPKIKRRVSAHDPSLLTTQGILIDDVRPSSLQIM